MRSESHSEIDRKARRRGPSAFRNLRSGEREWSQRRLAIMSTTLQTWLAAIEERKTENEVWLSAGDERFDEHWKRPRARRQTVEIGIGAWSGQLGELRMDSVSRGWTGGGMIGVPHRERSIPPKRAACGQDYNAKVKADGWTN